MDLLPPSLIVGRYFSQEQTAITALQAQREAAARELEEFVEEHTGEEGLLAEATNDKRNVTKSSVNDRLKVIRNEPESDEEREALTRCLSLIEAEAETDRAVKAAQAALDEQVLARYARLTEVEIKVLVVEDKWFATVIAGIHGEVQRITQQLAARVKELDECYARRLSDLEREVEAFSENVEGHLKQMGLAWR